MALPLQEISDRLEIEEVLVATATLSTIEIGTRIAKYSPPTR